MTKQSLPLSPLLKEIIGVTNMGRTVNSKKTICKSCGEIINKERLLEVPHTSKCFDCKSNIK